MTASTTSWADPRLGSSISPEATCHESPEVKHLLPNWKLERPLYESQASCVYQARPRDGRDDAPADYAIKILRGHPSPYRLAQFRREIWVGQHVQHPHLVPIFSGCPQPPAAHLIMPRLRGVSVRKILASGQRLALLRAVWITRQVAEALTALHRAGWMHGDIKPANLMVSREGHATLIDLGFVRKTPAKLRQEGPLMGSIAYAAPEMLTADTVDAAADVYSLAVTLFEMIAGRLPLDGNSVETLANAHLEQTPADVRDFNPLVPRQLAWLLRSALAKLPLRRPSSVEMLEALVASEVELLNQSLQSHQAAG